jgi:transposase
MKRRTHTRRALELAELEAIVERTRAALSREDHEKLTAALETLAMLTRELEAKGTSIQRLRRLLFGASTEKTSRVVPAARSAASSGPAEASSTARKGHGRNGAAAYRGAEQVKVAHESIARGHPCPGCHRGTVYPQAEPSVVVRVKGMAPLRATVYELERLRCNLCGEVFTAPAPAGVGEEKYDETAAAMIGLLKYGCGVPFNRLERLEQNLGIPLPAATQWEVVHRAAGQLVPAYQELIRQAAQGEVLHNDDTTMRILELEAPGRLAGEGSEERTGVFTSGIVSTGDGHRIALFFTGRKHAGENLDTVLAQRAQELGAPIQMCDALSRNTSGQFETIVAHCIAHARRGFVDVAENFPEECRYVLETLRDVYRNEALTRAMPLPERLTFHQQHSGPLMAALEGWLRAQFDERKVEPNSGLGEAMTYMRKHWEKLTLFLREPGAPLDNNLCERALKKAILHRKNAFFYKTQNGARVGDVFMSLIYTAELGNVDTFEYLVALQQHADLVSQNPGGWMPWTYQETLARLTSGAGPPP